MGRIVRCVAGAAANGCQMVAVSGGAMGFGWARRGGVVAAGAGVAARLGDCPWRVVARRNRETPVGPGGIGRPGSARWPPFISHSVIISSDGVGQLGACGVAFWGGGSGVRG